MRLSRILSVAGFNFYFYAHGVYLLRCFLNADRESYGHFLYEVIL